MEIVKDEKLSEWDEKSGLMMHGCGSLAYMDMMMEDHLVTLSNGAHVHVGMLPNQSPTMDDVIAQLIKRGEYITYDR
jgi:hypothetical protein